MFFLHEIERVTNLHPSYFDKDTHKYIQETLYSDVEGTNTGNYYIVCVVNVVDISEPRVLPGSSYAEFTITFQAVVWRPFKGEVCDGMVSTVVANGFFVDVGPLSVFVSKSVSQNLCAFGFQLQGSCFQDDPFGHHLRWQCHTSSVHR